MLNILVKDLNYIYENNKSNYFFKNKVILITGASGFLGSYFSNFFCYFHKELKIKKIILNDLNINKIKKNLINKPLKKCEFLNSDITKVNSSVYKLNKVDIVIHAASIASPTFYRKNPLKTAEANVDGLKNLLNFSLKKRSKEYCIFHLVKFMEIQMQKISQLKRHTMEMYQVLDQEHATMNLKDMVKLCVIFIINNINFPLGS